MAKHIRITKELDVIQEETELESELKQRGLQAINVILRTIM